MKKVTDPDAIQSYLEDSAHFPGGFSKEVYLPKDESDIIQIVKEHHATGHPFLVQGARTSLTGGATPFGESVLSLENLNHIRSIETLEDGTGRAVVEPFVRLSELQAEVTKKGLFYPPVPTYDLATIGGTVATCAAGSATFKYGTTRDWIQTLRIVLASGDLLLVKRGENIADSNGFIEIKTLANEKIRFQIPQSYQTPFQLKKVSCGYASTPQLDLIDLFIGSEGTLGVITEIEIKLIPKPVSFLSGLAFFKSDEQTFEFVKKARELSFATWKSKEANGLDLRAVEYLDENCLGLIKEEKRDIQLKVPLPSQSKAAIYFEMELDQAEPTTAAMEELETFIETRDKGNLPELPPSKLGKLFYLLNQHGALNLEELVLAFPDETQKLEQIRQIRESAPILINEKIGRLQHKFPNLTKVSADPIVPFERVPEMLKAFHHKASQYQLKVATFGHISDGNLHPNVLLNDEKEIPQAFQCMREAMKEIIDLGGAPMAEHGVGRNTLKQEFLELFYGKKAIKEMVKIKKVFDPRGILSPGVIFPKELLKENFEPEPTATSIQEGATIHQVGDDQGRLWHFSLKSLTKAQDFVNGFLARFLANNRSANELMEKLKKAGLRTSGFMTDYIAIPYAADTIRELKKRGFVRNLKESKVVFRHTEGVFPPFIIKSSPTEGIDQKVLDEEIPIEYEYDENDIWVSLDEVWSHLPSLEDQYKEIAKQPFPYLQNSEIGHIEVGWRVGDLKRFGFSKNESIGGPLYQHAFIPKSNKQEPQLVLVKRAIGIYNGFELRRNIPKLSLLFKVHFISSKFFYSFFHELLVFLIGLERVVSLLRFTLGPKWTCYLLNEVHDQEWFQNNQKGKKVKENIESILGKSAYEIFVDHRTLRRSLITHRSLLDRFLWLIGLVSKKSLAQNEVMFRILQQLGLEKHEEYIPDNVSNWKARVMRDRDLKNHQTRSQIGYFLDESLPDKRSNISTFSAFWGATTGWPTFDLLLAFLGIDWGPDPWFFHHLAIEGDFDKLAQSAQNDPTTAKEKGFLEPFSSMSFLRQVFSKEIRWVPKCRLQALYMAGRITRKEMERYLEVMENKKVPVEGPHIELIDRRSGIPWFNQVRITEAIKTSSSVSVESASNENESAIEPWHKRLKHLFK